MKRRILEKLTLTEISGVDRPCQEGARVTIMKRKDTNNMDEEERLELEGTVLDLSAQVEHLNKQLAAAKADTKADAKVTPQDFEATVAEIRKRDDCSGTEALAKARKDHPDAFDAYNRTDVSSRPIHKREIAAKSTADFMAEVDRTMIEKRLTRTAAMSDVRKRNPSLFEQFQET